MPKDKYVPPDSKINTHDVVRWVLAHNRCFVYNSHLYAENGEESFYRLLARGDIPPWILAQVDSSADIPPSVISEAIKRILWDPSIRVNYSEVLKRTQFLLNVKNGVYNIEDGSFATGEAAKKIAKDSYFTYCLQFSYIENASLNNAPAFRQFLETSLEADAVPDKQTLLLEIIGICISSVQIARKFYFFVGATKSGKSVIADLLQEIIAPPVAVTTFGLNQLSGRFNVQHLEYSRLNLCRELTAGKVTGTDTLKMLVSDEPLFVESKGKEGYVAHIHTKLLTCANQMPNFGEMDAAGNKSMTDRMVVLRFNRTISEEQMDRHLLDKLLDERDIIFSMAVDALKALHDRDYIFTVPDDTKELMESYLQESRSLELFLEEKCELTGKVHLSTFISAYKEFCAENALSPYKNKEISAYIANCYPAVHKEKFRLGGKYLWGWNGISIKQVEFGVEDKEEISDE